MAARTGTGFCAACLALLLAGGPINTVPASILSALPLDCRRITGASAAGCTLGVQRLRGGGSSHEAGSQMCQHILWSAAGEGDTTAIEAAISSGADVNAPHPDPRNRREGALHFAAAGGHLSACRSLIAAGAAVNMRNLHGAQAIHVAAEGGHTMVVEELVKRGAEVDAEVSVSLWTPLFFAAAHGHLNTTRLLLRLGAKVHAVDDMGNSILDTAQRWTEQPYEIAKKAKAQKGLGEVVPVDPDRETLVQELARASRSKVRTVFEIAGGDEFDKTNNVHIHDEAETEEEEETGEETGDGDDSDRSGPSGDERPARLVNPMLQREIDASLAELLLDTPNPMVKAAQRSRSREDSIEIMTLEMESLSIRVSERGFWLESRSKEAAEIGRAFETLHSLLMTVSPEYRSHFARDLHQRLADAAREAGAAGGGG